MKTLVRTQLGNKGLVLSYLWDETNDFSDTRNNRTKYFKFRKTSLGVLGRLAAFGKNNHSMTVSSDLLEHVLTKHVSFG